MKYKCGAESCGAAHEHSGAFYTSSCGVKSNTHTHRNQHTPPASLFIFMALQSRYGLKVQPSKAPPPPSTPLAPPPPPCSLVHVGNIMSYGDRALNTAACRGARDERARCHEWSQGMRFLFAFSPKERAEFLATSSFPHQATSTFFFSLLAVCTSISSLRADRPPSPDHHRRSPGQ